MKLHLISIFASILFVSQMYGQITISGKITDHEMDKPLIGTNITITQNDVYVTGATSDLDGNYSIRVEPGVYTIEFTYIGYQTEIIQEYKVHKNTEVELNTKMYAGVVLQEVVVVAYDGYRVVCQSTGCYYGRASCTHGCCAGVEKEEKEESSKVEEEDSALKLIEVKVYPNPASTFVTIEAKESFDAIKIISADGKIVYQKNNIHQRRTEVNLDGCAAGMYLIYYTFGERTAIEKLVVSKK